MGSSLAHRVQARCAAAIDRAVLHVMERAWHDADNPSAGSLPERQARALEVYGRPELVREPEAFYPEPEPARVAVPSSCRIRGGRIERCVWPSGYRTWDPAYQERYDRFAANRTAHAECARHDGAPRPTVICLHAWMASAFWLQRRAFWLRGLYRAGFDVVLFVLPFHGPRTPAEARFSGQLFPDGSSRRTNEAFGQLVWDVRALMRFLRPRSGPIGVVGMSLGGYGAALLASVEPTLAFVVPVIPVVDIARLMWVHGGERQESLSRATGGLTLDQMQQLYAVHSPLRRAPLVPRERLLIVAGDGDRICVRDQALSLWRHWREPRLHWWPGGHVAHFGHGRTLGVVTSFLRDAAGPA